MMFGGNLYLRGGGGGGRRGGGGSCRITGYTINYSIDDEGFMGQGMLFVRRDSRGTRGAGARYTL